MSNCAAVSVVLSPKIVLLYFLRSTTNSCLTQCYYFCYYLLFVLIVVGKSSKQQCFKITKRLSVQLKNALMTTTILTEFVRALGAPLGV